MGKIRFAICFTEQALAENGTDQVRFLMSANVGEELRPIHKIASGGELARIMLAMKNVLAEQDQVGTMVFDEVDTGVSGRAAQKVAEKTGPDQPHQAGAVRDPSAPAGRHGGHALFCGEGGAGRTHLYPGGAAGPGSSGSRSWPASPAERPYPPPCWRAPGSCWTRRTNSKKPWPDPLTTGRRNGIIQSNFICNSDEGKKYPADDACKENPWTVRRGRGGGRRIHPGAAF